MMSLFTLASQDQSVYYLGQLFGSVGSVLQPMGSGTSVLNIMGTMFQTLNTTALIIGSLLVTYTTVVGLLKTAQEGEFLGKQWSSMWVPLRMVVGIAALFPTGGGYSAIQIAFMWIILQGVAAGDSLWTTAINFIQTQGSPYASITTPTSVGAAQNIEGLYQALVCDNAARAGLYQPVINQPMFTGPPPYDMGDPPTHHPYYYCADPQHAVGAATADSFCDPTQSPYLSQVLAAKDPAGSYSKICTASSDGSIGSANNILTCSIGPSYNSSGACGSITLGYAAGIANTCTSPIPGLIPTAANAAQQCNAYQAQQEVLQSIVALLEIMAAETNKFDNDYLQFYYNKAPIYVPPTGVMPDWIQRHCTDVGLSSASTCCISNNWVAKADPVHCSSEIACPSGTTCSSSTTASGTCSDPAGTVIVLPTTCQVPDTNTGLIAKGFSSASNSNSNQIDYGNSSKNAAQSLLLMCGLGPYSAQNYQTLGYSGTGCMTAIGKPAPGIPPVSCSSTTPCLHGGLCSSNSAKPGVCVTPAAGDFITGQVNNYNQHLNTVAAASIAAASQAMNAGANSGGLDYGNITAMGWMMAGGYYYELAKQGNANLQAAYPPFTVTTIDPAMDGYNPLYGYRNNIQASQFIVDRITGQTSSGFSGNAGASRVISKQQQASQGILGNFIGNLTGGANPLVGMQQTGEALIITAQVLFAVTLIVAAVVAAVTDITIIALGTGIATDPAAAAWNFLGWTLMLGIMTFCGWCIAIGGMLSIYTPLIPYTIFTFGVIGWFFSVIEAMTAAPFVALGILSPGGQHDLLGRAEPAMLLLANIFLRPTLMIMGMMASMLFANIIVSIINSAFTGVMSDIYGSGTPDLLSLILFITAYTMLIIGVLNKTYSLIDVVPDRVLVWIGGQAGQGGGSGETLGQMKGAVDSVGGAAAGAMKGGVEAAKGAQDARKEAKKNSKDPGGGSATVGDVDHSAGVQGPQQRPK
jgi:hypothetical protein